MQADDDSEVHWADRWQSRENYIRQRRQTYIAMLSLIVVGTLVGISIVLLPPVRDILELRAKIMSAELSGMERIPDIESRLVDIQKRMDAITTGSMDERLLRIEKAMELGDLNPSDLASLSNLQSQMKAMNTYFFSDAKEIADFKELQKDYSRLSLSQEQYATKEALRSEISTLQTILTTSLAFFGILFTVLFGSWWFVGRKSDAIEKPTKPVQKPTHSAVESEAGDQP